MHHITQCFYRKTINPKFQSSPQRIQAFRGDLDDIKVLYINTINLQLELSIHITTGFQISHILLYSTIYLSNHIKIQLSFSFS